jgi:hypothetical protein
MYISEKRLTGNSEDVDGIISPGSKTICHAMAHISSTEQENTNHIHSQVKVKLDSCGSVRNYWFARLACKVNHHIASLSLRRSISFRRANLTTMPAN